MLTEFSVKNYKCLADVTLPLTPIHVLIGQNDTGKTSLLEAMRACSRLLTQGLIVDPIPSVFPKVANKRIFNVVAKERIEIAFKHTDFANHNLISFNLPSNGTTGIRFPDEIKKIINESIHHARNNPKFTNSYLRLHPGTASLPSELYDHPVNSLDEDGFGLATLLDSIKDYDVDLFQNIGKVFSSYFPQFQNVRLENSRAWRRQHEDSQVIESWDAKGKQVILVMKDRDLPLQQASDGAVLLLAFLALINAPKPPGLILIEEPENGFHPTRLVEIVKLLRAFTQQEKNAPQIILTTHSPYLLSEFQPEEVTLMRRVDGVVKAFPLRNAKRIHERLGNGEFYLGELWYNLPEEDLLK